MTTRIRIPRLATSLGLALLVAAGAVVAIPRGLIRSSDFSKIYWVDKFGVSHIVPDTGLIPTYFPNDIIKEIAWNDFMKLPKGGPITAATPPEFYDTATTRITMKTPAVVVPSSAPPPATVRTIERAMGAPPVVKKTETVRSPGGTTTTIETAHGAPPLSKEADDLLPATLEKRVETIRAMPQVVEKKTEVVTKSPVIRRITEVSTPDVVQQRTELITPSAVERKFSFVPSRVVEQRVETSLGAAPIVERKVVRSYGPAPVVERRIETSYGAAPFVERRIETGLGAAPVIETETVTTNPVIMERRVETLMPGLVEEDSNFEY